MRHRKRIHSRNMHGSGEHKIRNLPHLAGIAVFDRKHTNIALSLFCCPVSLSEIGIGNELCIGEDTF